MIRSFKLFNFQFKFREANKHNEITANNIFPLNSVKIGRLSYGPIKVHSWNSTNEFLSIGSFCSIASGVNFFLGGNHYKDNLSTFPFKHYFHNQEIEAFSNGPIILEDDVWVGSNVSVLSGVTIGQGCIVAAGSVVTKSFPPYSIIGGVPAKIIRPRFKKNIVEVLENVDFSKLKDQFIIDNLDHLYNSIQDMPFEDLKAHLRRLNL